MKQTDCKLCGKPFACDNGRWTTTCTCAKDRSAELEAAQKAWDESPDGPHWSKNTPVLGAEPTRHDSRGHGEVSSEGIGRTGAADAPTGTSWIVAAAKECAAGVLIGYGETSFAGIIERHARGRDAASEFAWLIEADGCYWDGHYADSRGFICDVNNAVRFSRREDAEAVKHWLLQAHSFALRTTQHGWVK